jgi:hypothetical protein
MVTFPRIFTLPAEIRELAQRRANPLNVFTVQVGGRSLKHALRSTYMKWGKCRYGSIKVNGEKYKKDIVLDRGELRKRKKKPSREFREQFGHTPVSLREEIPWECKRLIIGTGAYGRLPVMPEVLAEGKKRGVEILTCSTPHAVRLLKENSAETNAILHVTC